MTSGRPGVRRVEPLARVDAELGPVRWCGTCAEWWPDDDEFWTTVPAGTVSVAAGRPYVRQLDVRRCRAHVQPAIRVPWDQRRDTWRERRDHQCRSKACIVIVPTDRDICYGCLGETVGPLTVERLHAYGMAA